MPGITGGEPGPLHRFPPCPPRGGWVLGRGFLLHYGKFDSVEHFGINSACVVSMSVGTILLIILILLLLGVIPAWPHSRNWGYAPGGTVGTLLILVILLLLLGYI